MVTTPLLPRRPGGDGRSDGTLSFWPVRSPATLPPTKGATKPVPREALGKKLRQGFDDLVGIVLVPRKRAEAHDSMRVSRVKGGEAKETSMDSREEREG